MIARTTSGMLLRAVRLLLPLDGILPTGHSLPPDVVVLVPTLHCNLKCPYCFQRNEAGMAWHPVSTENLSLAEWQAVIAELKPLGPHVIVMGGELFLYRQALDLLRSVKAANLPLTIITNGIMLPHVAADLVALRLDRLIVSLDGPAEVHNAVRGHPHGYELAVEGIKQILAQRKSKRSPFVQVSCAVTAHTQDYLASFAVTIGSLGVDRIVFNGLIYSTPERVTAQKEILSQTFGLQHCQADVLVNNEQLKVDVTRLKSEIKAIETGPWGNLVVFTPPGLAEHLEVYYAPDASPFIGQTCTAIYRELWILPNGDVGVCVHINELNVGNVRQGGIMSAWNSQNFRLFRKHLTQGLLPACGRCEKLSYKQPPKPLA